MNLLQGCVGKRRSLPTEHQQRVRNRSVEQMGSRLSQGIGLVSDALWTLRGFAMFLWLVFFVHHQKGGGCWKREVDPCSPLDNADFDCAKRLRKSAVGADMLSMLGWVIRYLVCLGIRHGATKIGTHQRYIPLGDKGQDLALKTRRE